MDDNIKYITVSEQRFKDLEKRASLADSNDVRVIIEERTTFMGPYFDISPSNTHLFRYKSVDTINSDNIPFLISSVIEQNKVHIKLMELRTEELKKLIVDQTTSLSELQNERSLADSKLYLIPMWIRKIFGAV